MKEHRSARPTRRDLLGAGAAGVAAIALANVRVNAQATPAAENGARTAVAPDWTFIVHTFEDPYTGDIQVPQERPAGMRFAAAEIEVVNDSDQSLAFTPIDVRLRTLDGTEYRGGSAIGTDPTINPRNLNPGERSRGWVLFTVPEGSEVVELVYLAPQPQFRIQLPSEAR